MARNLHSMLSMDNNNSVPGTKTKLDPACCPVCYEYGMSPTGDCLVCGCGPVERADVARVNVAKGRHPCCHVAADKAHAYTCTNTQRGWV